MAVTAVRSQIITFSGDLSETRTSNAANNAVSPAQEQLVTLTAGSNVLTAPASGSVPTCLTLIPPVANTQTISITGSVLMHLTDPAAIPLAATFVSITVVAGGTITGMRVIWS